MMVRCIKYSPYLYEESEIIDIATIPEPPLEEIWRVEQRAFAFLSKDSDKNLLETLLIANCIGVYVRNSFLSALLHADTPWSRSSGLRLSEQVNVFLDYLDEIVKEYHLTSLDESIVVASNQSWPGDRDEICLALQKRGYNEIKVVVSDEPSVNVIFDKNGNLYWVNPKTIKDYDRWFYESLQNLDNDGLKCMNTGEIVRKPLIKV
jgi:hypothetical protein